MKISLVAVSSVKISPIKKQFFGLEIVWRL
jgi:hypothetical protein